MTLALARQYRPSQFSDVIGQPFLVKALSNALDRQQHHHAYLFTGTRGVGKTTIARIFARCLNCEHGMSATPCLSCHHCQDIAAGTFPDLIEVDAASRTKVEDTRELLDNVMYLPTVGRFKVYLIDEVHMLSGHSFNALLKTLEEPPPHVIFLLATTDPQKLPATILSRCLQFHLQHVAEDTLSEHIQHILKKEDIAFEVDATTRIAQAAKGSVRDALSLLEQAIAYSTDQLTCQHVQHMLGMANEQHISAIFEALAHRDAAQLFAATQSMSQQGVDFGQVLDSLASHCHQLALLKATPDYTPDLPESIRSIASLITPEDIQLFYQIALTGKRDLTLAPSARCGFEMTLLRMLAFTPLQSDHAPTDRPQFKTESTQPADPSQPKPTPSPRSPQPTSTTAATDWRSMVNQLDISGATLALARHCEIQSQSPGALTLLLDKKQKPLLSNIHIERITAAVSTYFQTPTTVSIAINDIAGQRTPAEQDRRQEVERQQAAEQAVCQDQTVREIQERFGGTVIKDSIQSIKSKKGHSNHQQNNPGEHNG